MNTLGFAVVACVKCSSNSILITDDDDDDDADLFLFWLSHLIEDVIAAGGNLSPIQQNATIPIASSAPSSSRDYIFMLYTISENWKHDGEREKGKKERSFFGGSNRLISSFRTDREYR